MDNPRNTDNSGYTRNKDKQVQTLEKTKGGIRNGQSKKHWQLWVHKTQDEDKQAQTLEKANGAIRNGQSKKHWQLWVHKTQDEDKQAQKTITEHIIPKR
jgi:hypothetical protein